MAKKRKAKKSKSIKKKIAKKKTKAKKKAVGSQKEKKKQVSANKKKASKKKVAKRNKQSIGRKNRKPLTVKSNRKDSGEVFEKIASREEIRESYESRCEELCGHREKAERILTRFKKSLASGKYGKITGCTVGFRTKCGRIVLPLQHVIEIGVPTKYPEYMFTTRDREIRLNFKCLPESYYGVQVKVIEARPYLLEGAIGSPLSGDDVEIPGTTLPPDAAICATYLKGGLPIRKNEPGFEKSWGTIGVCFKGDDGEFRAFTNAHVANEDDVVVQPPLTQTSLCWVVGQVEEAVSLSDDNSARGASVDAAIVKLIQDGDNSRDFSDIQRVEEVIGFNGLSLYFAAEELNETELFKKTVFKYGARTGLSAGEITNLEYNELEVDNIPVSLAIEVTRAGSTLINGGDSGAALLIPISKTDGEDAFLVGGIFFAGVGTEKAYACQITDIINVMEGTVIPNRKLLLNSEWTYRDHQIN